MTYNSLRSANWAMVISLLGRGARMNVLNGFYVLTEDGITRVYCGRQQ